MTKKEVGVPESYYKLVLYSPDGTCSAVTNLNAGKRLVEKMIALHDSHTSDHSLYSTPPTQYGWSGEGLPPVGTVCDCLFNDQRGWSVYVIVEHYTRDGKSVVIQDGEEYYVKPLTEIELHPIKSDYNNWLSNIRKSLGKECPSDDVLAKIHESLKGGT